MTKKKTISAKIDKPSLHPRNLHKGSYDFEALCSLHSELQKFVQNSSFTQPAFVKEKAPQQFTIDFSNPKAVKELNRALLKLFYQINYWDIPPNYLCPPVPGRVDYIHYLSDLLNETNNGKSPIGNLIKVLDIGTGANCIYPMLGTSVYGWKFIGTDIDPLALKSAADIVQKNPILHNMIELRLQSQSKNILNGILRKEEFVDLTMCNPPFHASAEEAMAGTERKWKNLGIQKDKKNMLNFGGQKNELWCEGGENTFVCRMVKESSELKNQCLWFSTLISKKTTLPSIYYALQKVKAIEIKTIDMAQGQKISRVVAWTFLTKTQQQEWLSRKNNPSSIPNNNLPHKN